MTDIVGIGASLYDIILKVSDYPVEDTKVKAQNIDYQCGGPAATGIVTASILGADTVFLGLFTNDRYAEIMLEDFRKYNIDTSKIAVKDGYTSGLAVVVNSENKTTRTIIWTQGTIPSPEKNDIPVEVIKNSKMLYLDGNHMEAAVYACKTAKKHGVKILLDAGAAYNGIETILEYADIIIASENFSIQISGKITSEQGAKYIKEKYSPEVLIVTMGDKGGIYYKDNKLLTYPPFNPPGKVLNTNAAGDVFHGAFAYFYLQGNSIEKCISFASAASAIKCTKARVREDIPSVNEILSFINNQ